MPYKNENQRLPLSLPPHIRKIILGLNLPGSPTKIATWLIEEGIAAHPELLQQSSDKRLDSVPPKIPDTTI